MNRLLVFPVILLMIGLLACSDEETVPTDRATIIAILIDGPWRVSFFFDKDEEETDEFDGLTFQFDSNGVFEAFQNGSLLKAGTWQLALDDGRQKLIIDIEGTQPLDELNEDWDILEVSSDLIRLEDNRDDNEEELLHFAPA